MREIPHKADRVGEHDVPPIRQVEPSHGRIERREQLILDVDSRVGQRVEQGRLTRIRVPDERHCRDFGTQAIRTIHVAPRIHVLEAFRELADTLADESPVRFELGFTRSPQSNTAFLPLEVSPPPYQARRQVAELCKLNLQLALEAARTLREYIEDEASAINHATLEFLLQVSLLARTERSRGDDELRLLLNDQLAQFVELAPADKIPGIRPATRRNELANELRTCRQGQLGELLSF